MSFFYSLWLSLYFCSLVSFLFVSHPIIYCLLLLLCSLSVGSLFYLSLGFSWYLLLFVLVYIGGVYVLLIFVSVMESNPVSWGSSKFNIFLFLWLFFYFFFFGLDLSGFFFVEKSSTLCCGSEGYNYVFYCLILLLGFLWISFVFGDKGSFYR